MPVPEPQGFNLASVFGAVAAAVPDQVVLVWRDRRVTYAEMDARIDGFARYLVGRGLGVRTERGDLPNHESGQDHLGVYLRNGNEYLEATLGAHRARVASFNVNYRYVEEELLYLLTDARTRALVYHAEFAPTVASIRDRLPELTVLVQVADDSGNALLPGAVDYEETLRAPEPAGGMPTPSGEDLYLLYTGGTTGMPKGVLWKHHDIYVSSMGGTPFGAAEPFASYEELQEHARNAHGGLSLLMVPPFMHGAAQWSTFHAISSGGKIAIPDDVHSFDPVNALEVASRERVMNIVSVGDAIAKPIIEEVERGSYDLSGLVSFGNGGAALTPGVRERIFAALPNVLVLDSAGSSETGLQMSQMAVKGGDDEAMVFTPQPDTWVLDDLMTRPLERGEAGGWLARRGYVPLGYLDDPDKSARTFPVVDGVRWSVPGDRASVLEDGRIRLLGRESVTINSGGEKIFAEEVERAVAAHPGVRDVVVAGRPSERWGHEVVAVVQLEDGAEVSDEDLLAEAARHVARYKLPKAIVRVPAVQRSPAGKADYRWAKEQATGR
ncbi:acyl-CoA synthetase [Nocardioides mangrovi]|uniref:Acyl-CoA synthetase n=1 Tax=Nocardioides mangrovi TaxID=2874580 RepID=A0ABS7U7G8_9ACTN|nr:acyl-CoA synthetase [Nocardioides mangrovi]MBZ5736686.1 acyl-CoA synthetase [Nocardioides mangrovi]